MADVSNPRSRPTTMASLPDFLDEFDLESELDPNAEYSPCVGCGYCCKKATCGLGATIHGAQVPCPSLVFEDGRYWCGEVLTAERTNRSEAEKLKSWLYIGVGCCSPLNSDRWPYLKKMKEDQESESNS